MTEESDNISDGYHTFGELYEHRAALLVTVMVLRPDIAWMAVLHDDGTTVPGFFIAGLDTPKGQISYHVKRDGPWWNLLKESGIKPKERAPQWDGHTPEVALARLIAWCTWMSDL